MHFNVLFFISIIGVNNIIFYSASIFKEAGSSMNENVAACVVGGAQVIATMLA